MSLRANPLPRGSLTDFGKLTGEERFFRVFFRRVNGDNETPFARDFERGFDAERNGDAPPPPPRARSFFERRNEKG